MLAIAANVGIARAEGLDVSAPRQGETLRGGSFALLSWSTERWSENAQEWEAFLSIDGGAHYAFRITPHLDISLRQVTWLVPNVDATDAQILIRIGNEKHEKHFAHLLSFSISRGATVGAPMLQAVAAAGEAARDDDDGVVQWAEGDRAGTRVSHFVTVVPAGCVGSLRHVTVIDPSAADAPKRAVIFAESAATGAHQRANRQTVACEKPIVADILTLSHRQNV